MTPSEPHKPEGLCDTASVLLADLSWQEAEKLLKRETLVVIPLGAAAKQHGPHLKLDNDYRLANALSERLMRRCPAVYTPTVPYHHYPAFKDYPGTVSLRFSTARDLIVDMVSSLASYGPRRFYVLNTGVSTEGPLRAAAELLQESRLMLRFTDILTVAADVEQQVAEQARGSHADEIETSLMLYLEPGRVDQDKAVRDDHPRSGAGGFSRRPDRPGIFSPSGTWGDPTLATRDKGIRLAEAIIEGIAADIERLRNHPLPP